jgi:hypothetical protein
MTDSSDWLWAAGGFLVLGAVVWSHSRSIQGSEFRMGSLIR